MSLPAKEKTVLQDTLDRLTEIGTCNGMEKNVEKTKVMRISRQILTDQNKWRMWNILTIWVEC